MFLKYVTAKLNTQVIEILKPSTGYKQLLRFHWTFILTVKSAECESKVSSMHTTC